MFRSRCLLAVISIFCGLMLFSVSTLADLILAEGKATGQWYNPARDGEGFYVEVVGEGDNIQIAIAMYSYDSEGEQLWVVGNVPISADATVATVPLFLIEGPVWGSGYDPADRETTEFGDVLATRRDLAAHVATSGPPASLAGTPVTAPVLAPTGPVPGLAAQASQGVRPSVHQHDRGR